MAVKIQLRRDTASNWSGTNPVLAQGEVGYETDSAKIKFGTGAGSWNDLSYYTTLGVLDDISNVSVAGAGSEQVLTFDGTNWVNSSVSGLETDPLYIAGSPYMMWSGNNISLLTNDSNYVASGANVSSFVNDVPYLGSEVEPLFVAWQTGLALDGFTLSGCSGYISQWNNDSEYITSGGAIQSGADISNFNNDSNYAISGGDIIYSGANNSLLNNDSNYAVSGGDIVYSGNNISVLNNDVGYTSGVYLPLNQTVSSVFTGGSLTGTGFLTTSTGSLGIDTNSYIEEKLGWSQLNRLTFDDYQDNDFNFVEVGTVFSPEWQAIDMSSNGRYQVALDNPNGHIYLSKNYGLTWTAVHTGGSYLGVGMSADGSRITVGTNNNYIMVSTDFGATWNNKGDIRVWQDVKMSSTGKYQTIVPSNNDFIYRSDDYGNTWALVGYQGYHQAITMSADGKYQTVAGIGETLLVSNDYGQLWAPVSSSLNWNCASMSKDGRYQVAGTLSQGIFYSQDYGVNWSASSGIAGSEDWREIRMCADGSRVVAVWYNAIWISVDYGKNFTKLVDSVQPLWSAAISNDGTKITIGAYSTNAKLYVSLTKLLTQRTTQIPEFYNNAYFGKEVISGTNITGGIKFISAGSNSNYFVLQAGNTLLENTLYNVPVQKPSGIDIQFLSSDSGGNMLWLAETDPIYSTASGTGAIIFSGNNISNLNNDSYYVISGANIDSFVNNTGFISGISGLETEPAYNSGSPYIVWSGNNISLLNNDSNFISGISGLNASLLNNDVPFLVDETDTLDDVVQRGSITNTPLDLYGPLSARLGNAGYTTPGALLFWGGSSTGSLYTLIQAGTNTDSYNLVLPNSGAQVTSIINIASGGQLGYDENPYVISGATISSFVNDTNFVPSGGSVSWFINDVPYQSSGAYVYIGSETDTLDTVVQRGNTTTRDIFPGPIRLNDAPIVGSYSGFYAEATAGQAMTFGLVCYRSSASNYQMALANSSGTMPAVVMAVSGIAQNEEGNFLHMGYATWDGWNWSPGSLLYVDPTNAGSMTTVPPVGVGSLVQIVGYATTGSVIFFNPDMTILENRVIVNI